VFKKFPKVTIGLVLHKNEKYLKPCLTSLLEQDYPYIEFLIRDQSPKAEAYEYIKKELPDVFDRINITKGKNLYHSGGHNELIRKMIRHGGDYYFCCSVDMLYPRNFVSSAVRELEKPENKKFGSATCKLMKWDFSLMHPDYPNIDKTNRIDSCGLGITKSHYFYDVGQGETDKGQYNHKKHIFGASGALVIYRKEALKDAAFKKEYFDELIHYKNDVDLAYRLQWAGWPCLFIPEVKVYHDRLATTPYSSKNRFIRMIKARKTKSKWIKENSFLGHQIVLIKNYSKGFSFKTKFLTTFRQWGILLFTMMFEPYLLKQLRVLKKNEKRTLKKRDAVIRNVKPERIEKLMN